MSPADRKAIGELVSALVDGRGDEVGMERLDALLTGDPAAQAYYLHYCAVHADLERLSGRSAAEKTRPATTASSKRIGAIVLALAACAVFAFGFSLWLDLGRKPSGEQPPPAPSVERSPLILDDSPEQVIAVVGNAQEAGWDIAEHAPAAGLKLGRGEVRLETGRLRLDFHAGEEVTVEGPAVFELVDTYRLALKSGSLVARVAPQGRGFTVIVPNGAIVDLGTEFAVRVGADGSNRVKVLKGAVMASSTNSHGHTSWEQTLVGGDEFAIVQDGPLVREAWRQPPTEPLPTAIRPLSLGASYADAVMKSHPVGFWRFDEVDPLGRVPSEIGTVSMDLGGAAFLDRSGGGGFLVPAPDGRRGYAMSSAGFADLNTTRGCSMEFWAYSDSVEWQTLGGLMLDGPRPEGLLPQHAKHQPPFSPSPIPSTAPSSAPRKKQIPSSRSPFYATISCGWI